MVVLYTVKLIYIFCKEPEKVEWERTFGMGWYIPKTGKEYLPYVTPNSVVPE
jgi:hypothetical protein